MALATYETRTRQLLQNPGAPTTLYATSDIDNWINQARQQLASEGECIQAIGTIQTSVGNRVYNFTGVDSFSTGIASALKIERINMNIAGGQSWVTPRSFPYFELYFLNNAVVTNGPPKRWSQLGQGSTGTFYLDPPPDAIYTLQCRCVCLPSNLASDADPETIPFPWTDAIAYYAAYLALLSAQSPARQADGMRYFNIYTEFVQRARTFSNPDIVRHQYIQAQDETLINKLAMAKAQGGGQ